MPIPQVPLADQCAQQLASAILAGEFQPGTRLDEVALGERLGVSRNTLREAFRLVGHDQLVEHRPNRGVFVVTVDSARSRHLFGVRRHLELGTLDDLAAHRASSPQDPGPDTSALAAAVELAEQGRDADDWGLVGTANARFHLALVDLGGNPVASRMMHSVIAQTRLRYLALGSAREVHESFLDENRAIGELVAAGYVGRARSALEVYLLRAERAFA